MCARRDIENVLQFIRDKDRRERMFDEIKKPPLSDKERDGENSRGTTLIHTKCMRSSQIRT